MLAQESTAKASTEGDATFYRKVQTISVMTDLRVHTKIPSHTLEKNFLGWPKLSSKEMDQLIAKILYRYIHNSKSVQILLSGDSKENRNSEESEPLEFRVRVIYWNGDELTPQVNSDLVTVSMEVSRTVARNKGFGEIEIGTESKHSSPYLISVSKDQSEFEKSLESYLSSIFQVYAKKINCGNGISDDCAK